MKFWRGFWVVAAAAAVTAHIARADEPAPSAETETAKPGASAWTATASRKNGGAGTFEALAAQAMPAVDLGTLIAPFVEDCEHARREIDKARCRGTVSFLRQTMPAHTYAAIVSDADAVTVSDYDARVKGFRVGAVGCLACKQPVSAGKGEVKRMVTLRMPDKNARTLPSALQVAEASLTFADVAASKAWLAEVRPNLRVQYIFEPTPTPWTYGPSRGFAFNLLGARIFNHCTGEVLYSQPKSEGMADKYSEGDECDGNASGANGEAAQTKLAATDIARGMQAIKPELDRCHKQFQLRGRADLEFVITGATGLPRSVVVKGSLGGTTLGQCLTDAARKAQFPRFSQDSQSFSYPVLFETR
ncbi:MAG: hypothetical protein SF187_23280 [Deltaproteobacteria bacterium]|nr:hypothetical protein [Deltaproteobacteria bacterium]